jgi:hypothetical protein
MAKAIAEIIATLYGLFGRLIFTDEVGVRGRVNKQCAWQYLDLNDTGLFF